MQAKWVDIFTTLRVVSLVCNIINQHLISLFLNFRITNDSASDLTLEQRDYKWLREAIKL